MYDRAPVTFASNSLVIANTLIFSPDCGRQQVKGDGKPAAWEPERIGAAVRWAFFSSVCFMV